MNRLMGFVPQWLSFFSFFYLGTSDFTAMDEVFELKSTRLAYEFTINIANDGIVEEEEEFIVILKHVSQGGNIDIFPDVAIVKIADDDGK